MKSKPTLHDVSAAAKVSTYTASRALNGGAGVSVATREKVREVASRIGYVPNHYARSLKKPQSNVIAVLIANLANSYYVTLLNGIETIIEGNGYDCVSMDAVIEGSYSQRREDRFVASIMAQRVAAVVVTYHLSAENMSSLALWGVPIVFVDCKVPEGYEQYSSIMSDSYWGSYEMGCHLANQGHRKWVFVGYTPTWGTRGQRQAGFEAAAEEVGASVDIIEGENSSFSARQAVVAYLAQCGRDDFPDVIYASNAILLYGTFQALRQLNLVVPADTAVVGYDDFEWADMLDPPVTVIDQDIKAIGRKVGECLLDSLKNGYPLAGEEHILKPTLRIRQSCGFGYKGQVPK